MSSTAKAAGPADNVDLSLRAGWGVGALGVALLFNTYSTLLLFYLTNIAGVAAGVAGTLLAIAKAYDWATDVPMGILSDRTRSRFGRRRPWLLLGAFVCGGAFVMLFSTPAEASDTLKAAYVLGALILFNTGYTLFNVPHLSMPAEMSASYDERTAIMSFRAVAIVLGTFIVGGFAPAGGGLSAAALTATRWSDGLWALPPRPRCWAVLPARPAPAPRSTSRRARACAGSSPPLFAMSIFSSWRPSSC